MPAVVKVWQYIEPDGEVVPFEQLMSSGEQNMPSAVQLVPLVTEWPLAAQTHCTVSPTLTVAVDGWNASIPFGPTMIVIATPASPQLSLPPELLLEPLLELELELLPPELLPDEPLLEELLPLEPLLELLLVEPLPLELPPSLDPELLPPPSDAPLPPLLPLLQPATDEA